MTPLAAANACSCLSLGICLPGDSHSGNNKVACVCGQQHAQLALFSVQASQARISAVGLHMALCQAGRNTPPELLCQGTNTPAALLHAAAQQANENTNSLLVCCHDELAQPLVPDAPCFTVVIQPPLALNTQGGLEAACRVVDACVDDLCAWVGV